MHDLARDEDDDKDGDKDGDDASIEDLLDHTRTILLESADARCLFITTLRGLDVCMLYLSQAYHRKAAAVLKAAGLPLAATGNADVGRRERMDGINVNSQSSARWRFLWCTASALQPAHPPPPKNKQADDDNATATVDHPPLCEWPESLLLRIAERALDSLRTADAMTTTYFDLLRHASGDIMLRCGVLAKAATTGATSDRMRIPCRLKLSIMERVLQAICKHVVMIKAQCAHARKHQQLQCCCLCFLLLRRRLFFFLLSRHCRVPRACVESAHLVPFAEGDREQRRQHPRISVACGPMHCGNAGELRSRCPFPTRPGSVGRDTNIDSVASLQECAASGKGCTRAPAFRKRLTDR